MPFLKLLEYMHRFNNFLTLGMHHPTFPISITLRSRKQLVDVRPRLIEGSFYVKYLRSSKPVTQRFFKSLYQFDSILNNFDLIVSNWFLKYDNLEPILNILLESFYNSSRFTENKFLNMAQAVETFHRRARNNKVRTKEEHIAFIKQISDSLTEELFNQIKEKLQGNEPNLHARIKELLDEFKPDVITKLIVNKDEFIKQVKENRNYYTHYDERYETKKGKKLIFKNAKLFYLTEKLKVLLIACILKEIGFTDLEINSSLNRLEYKFRFLYNSN